MTDVSCAGDIAQTALHYEGGSQSTAPSVLGPSGQWNCTYCPQEYFLPDRDQITALTSAEIYGGIDGQSSCRNVQRMIHYIVETCCR